MRSALLAALLAVVPVTIGAQGASSGEPRTPVIVNTGVGEVRLSPDGAAITVAVVTRDESASAAAAQNAGRMQTLLAALRRQRLPDSAIKTSHYSVHVERDRPQDQREDERGDQKPRYVATNAVRVELSRLDALGALIDTALAAGATEISRVTLTSSKASDAREKAIAMAVHAALADAAAAASAAGGSLGPVLEIDIDPNRRFGQAEGSIQLGAVVTTGAPVTQVLPQDIPVSVQVRVRSELLPATP